MTASRHAHEVVIRLTAVEDCWVEFTTPGGSYLSQPIVAGGTSQRWVFRHAVDMRLGNSGGIKLPGERQHPVAARHRRADHAAPAPARAVSG